MHKIISIFVFLTACSVAHAEWSQPQVRYYLKQQGVTNDTSGIVVSADDGIEGGWNPAWGEEPTKGQVEAIDYPTALEWTRSIDKQKRIDKDSAEIYKRDVGILIQAVLVTLKQKNPDLVLPTKAEVIAKFKELKQ